jgi:hypothetical protein
MSKRPSGLRPYAEAVSEEDKGLPAAAPTCQHVWGPRYIDAAVLRWRDETGDG